MTSLRHRCSFPCRELKRRWVTVLFKQSPGRGRRVFKRFGSSKKIRCFNDSDLWIYELIRLHKLQPKSGCLMETMIEIPALLKTNEDPQRQSWRWRSSSKGVEWTRSLEGVWSRNCVSMPVSLVVVRPLRDQKQQNQIPDQLDSSLWSHNLTKIWHVDMRVPRSKKLKGS